MVCPTCETGAPIPILPATTASQRFDFYRCADCGYGWVVERVLYAEALITPLLPQPGASSA
jgi:transposase-like protein